MFGWRTRVGVIVSPPNTVVENEFVRMAPEGVSIHDARLRRPEGVAGRLESNTVLDTNQEEMTLTEVDFPEEAIPGLKVVAHHSLDVARGRDLGDMEPSVACREARNIDRA